MYTYLDDLYGALLPTCALKAWLWHCAQC